MLSVVFLHIALPGSSISTLGSLEVFSNSASEDILSPGAIEPPKYSPLSDRAQKVVAVPKSIIMRGPPYLSTAATALTILSTG